VNQSPERIDAEQPIRIFIIDDHPTVAWGLERLIESEAPRMLAVGKAGACAEALAPIREARPDVVLLDLDLGAESGLDAIPLVLGASSVRILVLTGVRDAEAHEAAIRAGALGVVGKDIPTPQLLEAIRKVHRGELTVDRRVTERLLATIAPGKGRCVEDEKFASLTSRERDIVRALTTQPELGLKALALRLGISERTLRNHLTSIYEKLHVSGRLELYVVSSKWPGLRA
jgi:two-component system, NarL family, nitrate/nitrite response regulator NarL